MLLVSLMSGGLDSTTATAMARRAGWEILPLLVNYGQRHVIELTRARELAQHLGCREPVEVAVDLRAIGGSALTDTIAVPKDRSYAAIGQGIPATYVPARNLIFMSLALSLAEKTGAEGLLIGVNEVDSSGYPDCRPAFIDAFARLAPLATAAHTELGKRLVVEAPLLGMDKQQIVRAARELGVPISRTWSCYDPQDSQPCGRCDSCLIRQRAGA